MNKKNGGYSSYYYFLRHELQFCYIILIAACYILVSRYKHVSNTPAANHSAINTTQAATIPATCGSVTHLSACVTSMVLNADADQSNYTWSTGATSQSITVTSSGTYWWETIDMANNEVVNGNFTSGNSGFTSDYTYIAPTGTTGSYGALSKEAYYTVGTDPRTSHTNFASFPDHTGNTSGKRNMMILNGAAEAGATIWTQSITVTPNKDYIFSVWFTSVSPSNPGQLNFSINHTSLGTPIALTSGTPDWKNFTVRWNSGSATSAVIGIVNQNTSTNGNDFAIDDIVFAPVCRNYFDVNLYTNPPKPSITPL